VRGVSLADLCRAAAKAQKPMPLSVAIGITQQVCMALHHAHERADREGQALRIVHRDVTPHNIMISLDAIVKVMDFGVAQTSARVDTDAGAVRGTYAYMGPEQVRGRPLDKRADVFAVGVIMYELTTGRRLFRGTDVQVMTQIVERDVAPPSSLLQNYPPELETIVLGALMRDRGKRTPSAAHLALALDQFCMRHGLVTGPLMISHYIRSLFPYERAHEEGMGIAQVAPGSGSPAAPDLEEEITSAGDRRTPTSAEEMEERLLREELRALARQRTAVGISSPVEAGVPASGAAPRAAHPTQPSLVPPPVRSPAPGAAYTAYELTVDDLIEEERTAQHGDDDRLGLDRFDEDEEVKPVVLLSPKRKPNDKGATEGAFMSDLERRLREEADS
jgi:serine/threonine protein kinase